MDENYWKNAYQDTWGASSARETRLSEFLTQKTGRKLCPVGLGAESNEYISGSARRNGYEKGGADFHVEGTNIYVEVTGPLVKSVKSDAPLWFRPDKLNNALSHSDHDVFLVHHCMSADLWRSVHVDDEFKQRYINGEFPHIRRVIRGNREEYVEIEADDPCVKTLKPLLDAVMAWGPTPAGMG